MAIDSTKLVDLLARGIPTGHVAKALGVTDSRISQLIEDDRVKALVAERQAEIASEEIEAITSLEEINTSLISRIKDLVDESDSLNECVNAYKSLSNMVDAKKGLSTESEDGVRSITMQIPIFLQQNLNIQTNQKGEIIDIDSRSMATMPTISVHTMIKERAKNASSTNIDPDKVAL